MTRKDRVQIVENAINGRFEVRFKLLAGVHALSPGNAGIGIQNLMS